MASMRTGISREVDEEEYEDYEEAEIEEEVEGEDYEEAFEEEEEEEEIELTEEEEEEEEEIELTDEEEDDEKKAVGVQDYEEVFEEEEEEVEIEQNQEEEEGEKKMVGVEDYEEAFEEEEEEEMEIEQNEKEEEDEKKMVEVEDYEESFEEEEEEVEIEQNEEEEKDEKKMVEVQDYEEAFEEEEEMEIEQDEEEEEEDEKKMVEVQEDVEESVQEPVREEEKSANPEQPSKSEENTLPPPAVFPPFLQSVSDLEKLHCALSKFLYQWNSLNRSLDSINAAIDAHAPSQHDPRSIEQEKDERSEQQEEKDERSEQGKEMDEGRKQEKEKDERSWVEILYEEMDGKALLKYIESNPSHYNQLRQQVPEALRLLPNPEKLVFDALGKFYAQSKRVYDNNMPLVLFRRASVLLLEFLVLSGRPTGDSSVKGEANLGALQWWNRLINENIEYATLVDSLGLSLFLASFGIPKDFCSKDLGILLMKSNLKKKIDIFRRSSIIVEKIPGAIKDLIRGQMYFEAAELSCYFGLTDTFPPLPLLSSFVAKVSQTGKLERYKSQSEPKLTKEATIRELKSLRSVIKCMENHNLDIHNLTSVNIHQNISDLVKIIENDEMKSKKKLLKRKESSFPSASEASKISPSQMIQKKPEKELLSQPLLPDSEAENYDLTVAVKDYSYGWERKNFSSAQHFYQPQSASVYGNGGGILGRNLYKFVDTVIEEQLRKRSRNSSISPAFGHH